MEISSALVSSSCSSCSTAFSAVASTAEQNNKLNEDPEKLSQAADKSSATALTEAEQKQLQELKARDREVRVHEAAHLAAAGSLALSGASFTYQRGPDGVQYAIGGEVQIDTSAVPGNPEATLDKAQQIRSAALAPAQPSQQDLAVAAKAAQLAIEARAEINQEKLRDENKNVTVADNTSSVIEKAENSTSDQDSQSTQVNPLISQFDQTDQVIENLISIAV